jgi:hypothetical protein
MLVSKQLFTVSCSISGSLSSYSIFSPLLMLIVQQSIKLYKTFASFHSQNDQVRGSLTAMSTIGHTISMVMQTAFTFCRFRTPPQRRREQEVPGTAVVAWTWMRSAGWCWTGGRRAEQRLLHRLRQGGRKSRRRRRKRNPPRVNGMKLFLPSSLTLG